MLFSVIGIMKVFSVQGTAGGGAVTDPRELILAMLSGGLGLALVTTAVGLTMAVVHLSLGHVMRSRTWRLVTDLRAMQSRLRQVHADLIEGRQIEGSVAETSPPPHSTPAAARADDAQPVAV
jgi:biopolymer transport protein ExbB/TolQ